ncbi:hypothetical protein DLM85_06900 [Hymenobacter edaphi]|uniref:DUF3592 domain-containing protein n=1 Tax=Hymenobacter edaphi TaxID=2211146 RepID=A0A328BTU3_9BACT|nr:hypothetical protein DLM85_06900 [Hymenobacter edaphi]
MLGLLLVLLLTFALIGVIIYRGKQADAQKRAFILKDPGVTTGIITRRRRYKHKRVTVTYRVDGRKYTLRTRVNRAFLRGHQMGDTTAVVYAKADPSKAVLKATLLREKN